MAVITTTPVPARPTTRKLGLSQYAGYASGDAANNLAFSMTSFFLLLYYTDVVGISAAAVGTMFLVVRFWDAFADLFAGRLVDKAQTRWGKFRPFILFGSVPLLLLSVATFSVPGSLSLSGKHVYMYVSYALLGLLYSLVNIPYGSLAAAMTQSPTERAKLATWRIYGSNLTILMLAFVVAPQIKGSGNLQRSLTITTLAFVVVGAALYLFTFLTAKEQVQRDVPIVSLRQSFATLRTNRPLIMLCGSGLLFLTGMIAASTVGAFYARDVLGNANMFIWMTLLQTVGTFAVALFVPRIVRTLGKKKGYLLLGLVAIVAGAGITLSPGSTPAFALFFFFLVGIGIGGVNTLMWALEADTVEYGEWKTGVRTEGTTYALFSFTRKMGQALGGAAAAYTIGLGGYISGKGVVQTDSAVTSIKVAAGVVPAAFILLAIGVMFFYPLTEKVFRTIVSEVAERRIQSITSSRESGTDA
ncbi:MAG TPA: glucuronide transporter [Mycobacteriales bacterium]